MGAREQIQQAVRQAIKLSGLTQKDISIRAGISQKHLSQIVMGNTWSTPEIIDDVLAVCRAEMEIRVSVIRDDAS